MLRILKKIPVPLFIMGVVTFVGVCALLYSPNSNNAAIATQDKSGEVTALSESGLEEASSTISTIGDSQDHVSATSIETTEVENDDTAAFTSASIEESVPVVVPLVQVAINQRGQSEEQQQPESRVGHTYTVDNPDPSSRLAAMLSDPDVETDEAAAVAGHSDAESDLTDIVETESEDNASRSSEDTTGEIVGTDDPNAGLELAPGAPDSTKLVDLGQSEVTAPVQEAVVEGTLETDVDDATETPADHVSEVVGIPPVSEQEIEIRNPANNPLTVQFLLNSKVVKLEPGKSTTVPVGNGVKIKFAGGGDFGTRVMTLSAGTWAYSVSRDTGWQLVEVR